MDRLTDVKKGRVVAIVGSRTYPLTKKASDKLKEEDFNEWAAKIKEGRDRVTKLVERIAADSTATIVSGGAEGPDTWAMDTAHELGLNTIEIRPNWKKYGKRAGFVRNKEIIDAADDVIAFWDLVSRGTDDSVAHAFKTRKPLIVFDPKGHPSFAATEDDYAEMKKLHEDANPRPKMAIPRGKK